MKSSYKCSTAEYLEELGFKSEVAGSASAAKSKLALLRAKSPPSSSTSGFPTRPVTLWSAELRGIYPGLPILVASGQSEASLLDQFKSHERVAILAKPYTIEQLNSALRSIGVLE